MRDRERGEGAKIQAEGEAGSMQGARRGTRSRVSGITPWAEGNTKPLSHPGCPELFWFFFVLFCFLRFYLFTHERDREGGREREREAETQAEGEAGSMQGA